MFLNKMDISDADAARHFSGNAKFLLQDWGLEAKFEGQENSYIISCQLTSPVYAAGVYARIRLRNWHEIKYVAIGYTHDKNYRHIKAMNLRKNGWVDFGFSHQDIIWTLQNGMVDAADAEIKDVRIFIKGTPEPAGAFLDVQSVACMEVRQKKDHFDIHQSKPFRQEVFDFLNSYLKKSFRDYHARAKVYMETGKYPAPGDKQFTWELAKVLPDEIGTINTYRFAWHGQHLAIQLLLYAQENNDISAVIAARSLIENWLQNSFYQIDKDSKYTWYDHGTAERTLALLMMWHYAITYAMDTRFINQLHKAIEQHAQLLASEAFYAYNQPDRYHNHAWFQDAALIAVALAFENYDNHKYWLDIAIERFEDQLDKLIVRDGGFAIFMENSIGYHHGVQRLAKFVGQLVRFSGRKSEVPQIANELIAWSDFLRYPDGRCPAQGDTFRLLPRRGKDIQRGKLWSESGCWVMPKAGYAVVKGNHDSKPWMLCMFNTSLSKTHKHEDNLSITFWFDGIEWLIDPSFYSHEYDQMIPTYLRSAKAHNNLWIPGAQYSIEPQAAPLAGGESDGSYSLIASHRAYMDVEVCRRFSGYTDRFMINVLDSLTPLNNQLSTDAYLVFHLGEGVRCITKDQQILINHPDSMHTVVLNMPSDSISQFVHGYQDFKNTDFSVSGTGFMESSETLSVFIRVPESRILSWELMLEGNVSEAEF